MVYRGYWFCDVNIKMAFPSSSKVVVCRGHWSCGVNVKMAFLSRQNLWSVVDTGLVMSTLQWLSSLFRTYGFFVDTGLVVMVKWFSLAPLAVSKTDIILVVTMQRWLNDSPHPRPFPGNSVHATPLRPAETDN